MFVKNNIRFKQIQFLYTVVFCLIFNLQATFSQDVPEDLKAFLEKFSAAVLAHNTEMVMELMDADYKKEQHDAFLKGDTQKFLDQFFCGYDPADGERYECIKFAEVAKMEHTSTIPDIDLYIVLFHITDSDSTVEVTWIVNAKTEDGKTNFGMVGTYG